MKIIKRHVGFFLLAAIAGFFWASVYPYSAIQTSGDYIWLALTIFLFCLLELTNNHIQAITIIFTIISTIAGLITVAWTAASWRLGFFYPELPHILRKFFSTDGETSYHASDGQLFLLLFIICVSLSFFLPKVRNIYFHNQQQMVNDLSISKNESVPTRR